MGDWGEGRGGWGGGQPRGWPLPGESFRQRFSVTLVRDYRVEPGGVIHSPGRTDWDTGSGFWLGVDGDGKAKFGLGDPNVAELTWDGTALTISGDGSGLTSIDGGNIQAGTITATQIAAATITGDRIGAGEIAAEQLAAGSVTTAKIQAGAVTASKITVSTLSAIAADMGSLTAGSIVIGSTNKLWLNESSDGQLAIGGSTKASAPFRVTAAGALTATNATITGAITASSGSITGQLTITSPSGIIIAGSGTLDSDLTGIAFNYELITAQVSGVTQWRMNESGIVITIGSGATANDLLFYNETEEADAGRLQVQYDGSGNQHQLDALCYGYDFSTTTIVRIAALAAGSALADLYLTDGTIYTTSANFGIGTDAPLSPLHLGLATEDLEIADAGSTGATEQDWIEVEVGGNVGYIRVHASK